MAETAVVAAITKAISGASATTIAVGAAATAAVASIAISSVQMKKAQADARKDGSRAARDITVRSAIEPARIIYGQARTSGPVVYTNTASTPGTSDNSTLWTVISLCNHEVEDITDVWLDGDEILASQIVGGNVTSGKYGPIGSNYITNIYKRYGTSTQTHVTALSSAFTDWTSAYDGRGVAYIVTGFELGTATGSGEGVWSQGAPQNIRAVVKGKKVYDPRLDSTQTGISGSGSHRLADSSTWEWSDNPALCVADYLHDDRLGMGAEGITYNEIDWEMVAAAANVCDGTVTSPAGNQKRFTCNGALSTGETYAENIKQLLSSMGGSITWSGGKFRIRALAYEAPTFSFTGDDVIGDIQIQPEINRADRFNLVRGTFIDADSDYVATEFLPVESTTFRDDRDDGQSLNKQIKLPFTNNEYMAQRIAFKHLNVADRQLRCVVPMNYKAMKVAVGDRIQLSIDELTWTNKPFIVEGWVFAPDGGYELELREEDSDAYNDPVLGDYSTRTYAGNVIFPDPDVPAPSGLTATNEQEAVVLSWDEPSRPSAYNEIIVYASSSSAFSGASEIGRTRGNTFRHEIDIVPASYPGSATFYYWVQAVDIEGETSLKNPNSANSSIQGVAQKINTNDLDDDANFALTADWPSITDSQGTLPDDNATNNGSTIDSDGNIAGDIEFDTGGKIYLGAGNFNNADTGFYVDAAGQFSLKNKLAFYPSDSTLRVKGNIEADVISVTDQLQVAGNLVASSLQDGSITSSMLTEEAINAIFDRIATNFGGTNGDYKEQTGSFQTSGGTVTVGTSSDKFDHGDQDVVVELVENYGFSQTTDYTGSALNATVQFQVSADGTFTDLTSLNRTQTFTLNKYDLSAYYGSQVYVWYYGPRLLTTTYTAAQLSDNTDYQFRAVISSVGNAFTGIIYPVKLEVNEGVQGVSGSGGDATTLDGLDSTQFLRSDTSDTMTGTLTIDHSTFGQGLVLERQDGTNSSSIKFTNTSGTAGILYGRHSDNELVWRDGTSTNNFMLWHQGNDGPSSGLDADTVDGVEGSSLVRTDATNVITTSVTRFADNSTLRFGDGSDFRIWHNGTDTYFRNYKHGSNTFFQGEDTAGNNHAMIYLRQDNAAPYVQLFYDGGEVMRTVSGGIEVSSTVTGGKLEAVNSTTANELMLLHATSDRFADAIFADNGGSIRLRQDFGQFQVYTGGSANSTNASGAANRFEVKTSGINIPSGTLQVAGTTVLTSTREAVNLKRASLDPGDGNGYAFWDGEHTYAIWMSTASNSTYGGRVGGETSSDYNMYFKMQSGTNRGFVFKDEANAFFAINPDTGVRSEVEAVWQSYIRMDKAGTATSSTTSYPSQEIVFRSSGWDTNNNVARNCDWHVRAEASPSVYPDQHLSFYEQIPSYGHIKFQLHGRNSGASYQHPDAATFYGNVDIAQTSDSTGGQLRIGGTTIVDTARNLININQMEIGTKVTLRESADRANLLEIQSDTNSWGGIQITNASNEGRWSFMVNGSTGGIYDDQNSKWSIQFIEQAETRLYHNGGERLRTTSAGVTVFGALTATSNVTAYSDRRLKSDIQTLDGTKVLKMRGVSFTKDGEPGSGVIAQELEKVAPELVHDGEFKSVAYGNLVGYLIEAVKHQQQQIDELKALIEEVKDGNH